METIQDENREIWEVEIWEVPEEDVKEYLEQEKKTEEVTETIDDNDINTEEEESE